jgi:rubrerythrin
MPDGAPGEFGQLSEYDLEQQELAAELRGLQAKLDAEKDASRREDIANDIATYNRIIDNLKNPKARQAQLISLKQQREHRAKLLSEMKANIATRPPLHDLSKMGSGLKDPSNPMNEFYNTLSKK